jgi:hypothetical protein
LFSKTLEKSLPRLGIREIGQKSLMVAASAVLGNKMVRASFIRWKLLVPICHQASNTHMRSVLMISHATWRKRLMNLFGSRALYGGSDLITLRTSSSMKRMPSLTRLRCGKSRSQRFTVCERHARRPRLSSKKSKTTSVVRSSVTSVFPLHSK